MDDVSATFEWIARQGPLGPKPLFSRMNQCGWGKILRQKGQNLNGLLYSRLYLLFVIIFYHMISDLTLDIGWIELSILVHNFMSSSMAVLMYVDIII